MGGFLRYQRPSSPCGYCRYHKWKMSVRQIKAKDCLHEKSDGVTCSHFQPYTEHPYWSQIAYIKEKRRERKAMLAEKRKAVREGDR